MYYVNAITDPRLLEYEDLYYPDVIDEPSIVYPIRDISTLIIRPRRMLPAYREQSMKYCRKALKLGIEGNRTS